MAYDDDYFILTANELAQASDRLGNIARINVRPDGPDAISDAQRELMRELSGHVAKLGQLIAASPASPQVDSNPIQRTNPRTAESSQNGDLDAGTRRTGAIPDEINEQMADMREKVGRVENRLRLWARLIPLFLIVGVLVSYPYVALLTGMNAADMTQYISPVTGLAGAVIGYWFGQSGPGAENPRN